MQSSQRVATPMAKEINSLVLASSAPFLVALCAMAEKLFITSAAPSPTRRSRNCVESFLVVSGHSKIILNLAARKYIRKDEYNKGRRSYAAPTPPCNHPPILFGGVLA